MELIKDYNINCSVNQTESKVQPNADFQSEDTSINKFKVIDYFDYIYSYPPKIKIKWDSIDDLRNDFFTSYNSISSNSNLPIIDFIDDWTLVDVPKEAILKKYSISQYFEGFLNKLNSSNFFLKKTKEIQLALTNIPTFVVLNGHGEILLSKPSNLLNSKTPTNYVNEKLYDYCGGFDPIVEKKSELGLFFMNYLDAEKYLKEVAKSDFEGTRTVGLSIHCINLNSAYKITREHHPGIDFRFVPNFNEVKTLLTKNIGQSDMIIENEQQQFRFRYRMSNIFPYFNKLGSYLSPQVSFVQRNEYFKGVPIYIVQLSDKPRNLLTEQYFNIMGGLDHIYSRFIQSFDYMTGFGHNWIMESSIKSKFNSEKSENYIFFEKEQAIKFSKKNGRKVVRYNGGRTKYLGSIVKKPKILVYNLEDFLEEWENHINEKLTITKNIDKTLLDYKSNHFFAPTTNFSKEFEKKFLTDLNQSINVKFRVLKRGIGVFFSL